MTATNEVNVPGVFGDLFDVILAYPDAAKWKTIDSYPVVIAAGEIELTAPEGARLADYIQRGGTLVVAQGHLTGPGAAALNLPPHAAATVAEAEGFRWLDGKELLPSQRFRYYPLRSSPGDRPLAATREGDVFCLASDRGQGRLIYLSVPYGLGIDRQLHPATARLLAHVSRGLTPIEVEGDVEWLLNRTDSGWLVTLLNPAGQQKPQQGITPTDYRQNRSVTIRSRSKISSASDWLLPDQPLPLKANQLDLEVLAGGVRIIELKP